MHIIRVSFQVFMAASMKMTNFWDIAPCRLEVYGRNSETSVCFNETTRRYMAEGSHLHILRVCENGVLRRIFGPKRDDATKG
jgi:hypothetical protein